MKPASSTSKKTIRELVILAIVAVVLGFLLLHHKPSGTTTVVSPTGTTTIAPPIQTTFDQNALTQISTRDTNYPSVEPQPGELGKTDPFQ